jgi:hypothetical protein
MRRPFRLVLLPLLAGCQHALPTDAGSAAAAADCVWEEARPASSLAWSALSDAALAAEVGRACGRVFIGFREAGQSRGVDEWGRVLTSAGTVARMRQLVRERGVVIEHEYDLIPAVAGRMPVGLELVRELRHHPNVDYLEPIFPGTRW